MRHGPAHLLTGWMPCPAAPLGLVGAEELVYAPAAAEVSANGAARERGQTSLRK